MSQPEFAPDERRQDAPAIDHLRPTVYCPPAKADACVLHMAATAEGGR